MERRALNLQQITDCLGEILLWEAGSAVVETLPVVVAGNLKLAPLDLHPLKRCPCGVPCSTTSLAGMWLLVIPSGGCFRLLVAVVGIRPLYQVDISCRF